MLETCSGIPQNRQDTNIAGNWMNVEELTKKIIISCFAPFSAPMEYIEVLDVT